MGAGSFNNKTVLSSLATDATFESVCKVTKIISQDLFSPTTCLPEKARLASMSRFALMSNAVRRAVAAPHRRTAARLLSYSPDAQAAHRPLSEELRQRTLIALKPDCVQRNLCGDVLGRFERKGFKMQGLKLVQPTRALAEEHYAEHRDKPFFERACRFLCSGPVVASVWEGLEVISISRKIIGSTNPTDSAVGTIRGDYASHFRRNLVHGSDSIESAEREIALWFDEDEVCCGPSCFGCDAAVHCIPYLCETVVLCSFNNPML